MCHHLIYSLQVSTNNAVVNCFIEVKGNEKSEKFHQSSSTVVFYQRNPPSLRRKRTCFPSSINTVDTTLTAITATPAPASIPSHASVATIPVHVTDGNKNGSESDILYDILEIIEMGITPAVTVTLIFLREKIHNAMLRAQGYLQEEVAVTGSPNKVSSTSEP